MIHFKKIADIFTERRIMITLLLGFTSGLPLALSGSALAAWFTTNGVSLQAIGFVGLASLPYTFKFLWAPVMDRWVPPFLGRRRGWMLICQLLLCVVMAGMALLTPESNAEFLFLLACTLAFLSASQDIAVDAYRTDMLKPEERPVGAAMFVNGYRIAMLVSGGLILIIAHQVGWRIAYLAMSALMIIGIIATFLGPKPEVEVIPPRNLRECTVTPLVEFLSRRQGVAVLIFIVLYKLGDAFAGSMTQAFLIRGVGFTLLEIGTLIKLMGFIGTVLGTTVGGLWTIRLGYFHALFLFGILQTIANLCYVLLIWSGHNLWVAGFSIFMDNMFGGMGTAVFFGLLMGLCNPRFTAFQYALLSSLCVVGRVFIGPMAGMIAEYYGWQTFFISSVLFSMPGLVLLWWLRGGLEKMRHEQTQIREGLVTAS